MKHNSPLSMNQSLRCESYSHPGWNDDNEILEVSEGGGVDDVSTDGCSGVLGQSFPCLSGEGC